MTYACNNSFFKLQVDYPLEGGNRMNYSVFGYYFETDYGPGNQRVESLMYIQLYDVPDHYSIAPHGTVVVTAQPAYHPCIFDY